MESYPSNNLRIPCSEILRYHSYQLKFFPWNYWFQITTLSSHPLCQNQETLQYLIIFNRHLNEILVKNIHWQVINLLVNHCCLCYQLTKVINQKLWPWSFLWFAKDETDRMNPLLYLSRKRRQKIKSGWFMIFLKICLNERIL